MTSIPSLPKYTSHLSLQMKYLILLLKFLFSRQSRLPSQSPFWCSSWKQHHCNTFKYVYMRQWWWQTTWAQKVAVHLTLIITFLLVFLLCLISIFYSGLILIFCRIFLPPLLSLRSLKPNVKLILFAFWLNFQTQEYFCVRKLTYFLIHLLHPRHIQACPVICMFAKFWYLKG